MQKEFPSDTVDVLKGDTLSYALADYFEDAVDGDSLTYSAYLLEQLRPFPCMSLSRCPMALSTVSPYWVRGRAFRITVTAADTNGRTVSQSFRVRDQPRPSG